MATIRVHDGQSLFDIAIQACGSVEAAYDIAVMNGLSITDLLTPGQELKLPDVVNRDIANYFKNKSVQTASGSDVEVLKGTFDETSDITLY